jgi:hypothetical protein
MLAAQIKILRQELRPRQLKIEIMTIRIKIS